MKVKLLFLHVNLRKLRRRYRLVKYMRRNWFKMLGYKRRWLYKEVRDVTSINTALFYFNNFPKKYRIRLARCKFNLKPAFKRCESLHGKGNCEKITPTMVHRVCPKGRGRIGCCSCGKPCPQKYYKAKGFYCLRTRFYNLDKFRTLKECERQNKKGHCQKIGKFYLPFCAQGFIQEKLACRIACPKGYKMHHSKCRRLEITSMGSPFLWIHSDK